ncbi:MAG: sigma-70 family RNA polymerase sigma factor [Saprospiraceae bacterium]|nr:sigma-70 family RNA polymerase sigma factor [Saprospiraceae bacterium]MDW8483332.1 sigma-70 family RNA polymerase sigma factor [Saprospiraceae bacterium]
MPRFFRIKAESTLSDEELLAYYRRTSEVHYLTLLYERYVTMVYGVCLNILRDVHAAEDAVMSIYEELVHKVQTHQIEAFRGWLYVLARNYCLMELRRQKRVSIDYQAPEKMAYHDAVASGEEFELIQDYADTHHLQQCLQKLSDKQRLCIIQFYWENKSYREIALEMSEDIGKIRSYIQNGRRNLRLCMEKNRP